MRRGQGTFEYLIILAAILATSVVVVLIANTLLGTPEEANIVNEDKFNFAIAGFELRGYDKPYEPGEPAPKLFKDDEELTLVGSVGSLDNPIVAGYLHDSTGNEYPVYVGSGGGAGGNGSYYVPSAPAGSCGDGTCGADEDCASCAVDCGSCPVCGNGVLETGEECDDGNIVDGDGCSSTCEIEIMDTEPPSAVSNLQETHTDTTATLSWTAATDNVAVDHYNVYRDDVFIGTNTSDLGYEDTGLTQLTTYEYNVTAVDTSGNEGPGVTVTVTTSSTPTLTLVKSCSPGMDKYIEPDYKEIITMLSPLSNLGRVSLEPGGGTETTETVTFEKRAADNTLLETQEITSLCPAEGWCDYDLDPLMSFNTKEKLVIKQATWVEVYVYGNCDDANFDIKIKYISTLDDYDWMLRLYTLE